MIYPFTCPACDSYEEVWRPISEASMPEICKNCETPMERVWTPVHFYGAAVGEAEFNHGLGCVTRTAADRKEALKRINGENPDQHLVECDTRHVVKPKRAEYPSSREVLERIGHA